MKYHFFLHHSEHTACGMLQEEVHVLTLREGLEPGMCPGCREGVLSYGISSEELDSYFRRVMSENN